MVSTFAGDVLDGTARRNPSPAARPSVLVSAAVALWAVLVVAAVAARRNAGLLADGLCFAAIAAGVFVAFGPGAGLIAAGVAGLLVKDFGGSRS